MWYGVYNLTPRPTLPQHTQTHTHCPCSFFSSQRCSTASVSVLRELAAPWKPVLPPSLSSLSVISASFFDHSCLSGMSKWVGATEEGDKEESGDHKEKENRDISDHQHAGHCRRDQEGKLLEQLEGPGYWCVYCHLLFSLSLFWGCERWTFISACRLNIHHTIGVYPWVCLCVLCMCTYLSSNCICQLLGNLNSAVYLRPLSHGHALMTDLFSCMCVPPKKQKKQRGGGGRWWVLWKISVYTPACWEPSVLGAC